MNVEIVKFFVIERNEAKNTLTGSITVALPDISLNLLGIHVSKNKDIWFFSIPRGRGVHHETGKLVKFPYFSFMDREKQRDLINAIKKKARAYIEARLADKENPPIILQKPQAALKKVERQKTKENTAEPKEIASVAKPKSLLEWKDPPKRDILPRKAFPKR